jgi:ABC-type multidrug transport system ATPase subunit
MAATSIAIQTERLSKVFGRRVVLREIDLEVAEGEIVAITGANGAGKTTLLRCLASVLRPSAGEVRWFGRSARAGWAARRLVGLVAHESLLYPHLTLRENLIFAARMSDVRDPARHADAWLGSTGLGPHATRVPTRISRGMRQRLAVARALIHDPPIVLLDEPFSGLDTEGSEWLVRLLQDLRTQRRTICFAAHDPLTRRRLADRLLELQSGRVRELETDTEAATAGNLGVLRAA